MMACASGSILKSLSAAQLDKLKNQVVDLLQSSEGCLDLGRFKKDYKDFYKKTFDQQFGSLRSKKLKDVMAELDDVVSLEKIGSSVLLALKVTDESCHTSVSKDVDSAEKYKANPTPPDLKSQEVELDSKVPLSSSAKPDRGKTHPSVSGLDVKSPDAGKPKNVPSGESYSQPTKQKTAKGVHPQIQPVSHADASVLV